jgi:hypothetical protein
MCCANRCPCRWLYLFFFNFLWVIIPFWILYESYYVLTASPEEEARQIVSTPSKTKTKTK